MLFFNIICAEIHGKKQHKNVIHIMDKTLHLITEFTLAVGYLSESCSKAWLLYSSWCNDVSHLQVVRLESLFGDSNKRSECDQECISFTSSTHEASMMLTWTSFPHTQYRKRGRIRNDPHHHGVIEWLRYDAQIQSCMQPIYRSRQPWDSWLLHWPLIIQVPQILFHM